MSQAQLHEQAKAEAVLLSVCCADGCGLIYGRTPVRPENAGLSHGLCPKDEAAYYAANPRLVAFREARAARLAAGK